MPKLFETALPWAKLSPASPYFAFGMRMYQVPHGAANLSHGAVGPLLSPNSRYLTDAAASVPFLYGSESKITLLPFEYELSHQKVSPIPAT